MPNPKSNDHAKQMLEDGLGEVYHRIAMSCSVPFAWTRRGEDRVLHVGTAFFVDAGRGPFAVTARHVVEGYRRDAAAGPVACFLGRAPLDVEAAILSEDPELDIVTLRVSPEQVAVSERVAHGPPGDWPPAPPERERGIFFGGYPREELIEHPERPPSFGFAGVLTGATTVRDERICAALERSRLVVDGASRVVEKGGDWGGISGGPVSTVVAGAVDYWRLAGVVVEHSADFDAFFISPITRIGPEGRLREVR